MAESRFAIGDLASRGGVSRRTVRYYVQEGLLPAPLGLGRGDHYTQEHLDRLLRIKAMQEGGLELQEIRQTLDAGETLPSSETSRTVTLAPWRRVTVAPGVELHIAQDVALPPPARLRELADWCRQHFLTVRQTREDRDA